MRQQRVDQFFCQKSFTVELLIKWNVYGKEENFCFLPKPVGTNPPLFLLNLKFKYKMLKMKLNNYVIKILDQKGAGLRSVFQQCLFREMPSELCTIHSFKCCVPTAQQHSCIWLSSKQNVISWDEIEYIPLQVICQRITIFHAKEGCILIVFIMHSDQSHGKMETK